MRILKCTVIITILFASCQTEQKVDVAKLEKEIADAEKSFATMAAEKGIAEAFWYYADSNATIKRENDSLVKGKDQIRNYYEHRIGKGTSVTWAPDFISVSNSGDMAYTYGGYTWQFKDSAGNISEHKGVFHTVWKRQSDGSWKYVWD